MKNRYKVAMVAICKNGIGVRNVHLQEKIPENGKIGRGHKKNAPLRRNVSENMMCDYF
jgi:hypothetical protein